MIIHLAPGVASPVKAGAHLGKYLQPGQPVFFVMKNTFPTISTGRKVIEMPLIKKSLLLCHQNQ